MNENQKNIETCLPEDILAEVANVPTDAQFVSLVNESLDPLKQQAVEQAGSDAYDEVVQSHKPYTFTSTIVQLKSNLILLLRRLWRFPFGSGTLRSLADMWQHYIDRLSGNAEYGIPSRLDQLSALPSAPLLVADRKIGGADAPDGISLVRAISAGVITELTDNTEPWAYTAAFPWASFPNLTKATLNCKTAIGTVCSHTTLPELNLPYLESLSGDYAVLIGVANTGLTRLYLPEFKAQYNWARWGKLAVGCTALKEFIAPKFEYWGGENQTNNYNISNCPVLEKVVFGKIIDSRASYYYFYNCPKLLHLEFGEGTAVNLDLRLWNPSYVLSDNPTGTDLIEEGSTAENNLQQFLQNFHDYIAERLATFPEGTTDKTLTLSAAVYSAIWDNNGDPLPTTICQEIDTIIVDTKHWRPNKAS